MICLSLTAESDLDALPQNYATLGRAAATADLGRAAATADLLRAVERAAALIERAPLSGVAAARPGPSLASEGRRWVKEGAHGFAFSLTEPPIITGAFYETADLPNWL